MKLRIRSFTIVLVFFLLADLPKAGAQTVDASFQSTDMYGPGATQWVAQQADGKYLVLGGFVKSDTGPIGRLVRFNTDFTPDQAFNTAVAGLAGSLYSVRVLPAGQLLVVGEGSLTLAGVTRQDLLRLNANGTPDATFDAGTASSVGTAVIVEPAPNGQLLVGGEFSQYNGVAHNRLVRLTATGSVDATFAPPAFTDRLNHVAMHTNGKVLVACQNSGTGSVQQGLLRLNANGSFDNSFVPIADVVSDLAIQPDGKILIVGPTYSTTGSSENMQRLLPDGNPDATFQNVGDFFSFGINDERRILVQPDGRIIINGAFMSAPQRFNTNGSRDLSFQTALMPRTHVTTIALTNSGQVLLAGGQFELPGRRNQVVLLSSNGSVVPGFAPVLLGNGRVQTVAVQPDGMIIAGGSFDEANGTIVSNLARFRADGTLDASFAPPIGFYYIKQIVLQPDGKLLVAQEIANSQPTIMRLLPTGAQDASFQLAPSIYSLNKVLLQPDGGLLVLADTVGTNGPSSNPCAMRLLANGRRDRSFRFHVSEFFGAFDGALQLDGKLVLVNYNAFLAQDTAAVRLLPSGQPDPTFLPMLGNNASSPNRVVLQPDGKILLADDYNDRLRRLLPNGAFDTSFTAYRPNRYPIISSAAVQPNGRILLSIYPNSFIRLLPDGSLDPSFTNPGLDKTVADLNITPAGQLVAGGYFATAGGQRRVGLVRLNAANVLRVTDKQEAATTEAWPNPAHGKLQLSLQASAHPQRITLFNTLGEAVLMQLVEHSELTLNTALLAPGVYVLRVDYTAGFVTRRVVLE